jgi:hypothetical protein
VSAFWTTVFRIEQAHFNCQHSRKQFLVSEFWPHRLSGSILQIVVFSRPGKQVKCQHTIQASFIVSIPDKQFKFHSEQTVYGVQHSRPTVLVSAFRTDSLLWAFGTNSTVFSFCLKKLLSSIKVKKNYFLVLA